MKIINKSKRRSKNKYKSKNKNKNKYTKNKSKSTKCRSKNNVNYTRCRSKNKIKINYLKGGNNLTECVMCNKKKLNKYIPGRCLQENGYKKAHRICEDCWWNNFAEEGTNHNCPGCDNNIALNNITSISPNDVEIIELSDDDN
jgi:hypothetical protein